MSAVSTPPASRNTIRYSGGLQQPSNQAAIATCHALRWRQRYCQTRYTRRNSLCRDLCINAIWLVIPAISRIARSLNRQDRGRQQSYECAYNNQSELHHEHISMQHNTWDKSCALQRCLASSETSSSVSLIMKPRMWKHSLPGCWLHDNATPLIENLKQCNVSGWARLGYCEPNGAQGE